MTRTHMAIAVAGMFFAGISSSSQAAPIVPLAGADTLHNLPATQASWQGDWHGERFGDWHGHDRFGGFLGHRRSEGRHGGGTMSRFGGMRSIMAMMGRMGGSEGGGGLSMLNAIGGMGGMQSMMSAMGGMGSGGMEQMLGAMGGGGGGMQAMIGAMAGGGMAGGGGHASESARQACTPDAMRLCSDAIPDMAKVKACMQAKSSQLSEPCRAAINGGSGTPSASAGREFASSAGGRDSSNFTPRQRFANSGGQGFSGQGFSGQGFGGQGFGNFRGGRDYDNFQGGQGYDSSGGVQAFGDRGYGYDNFEGGGYGGGRGDMNIGQMMGMARSIGFGGRDNW